MKTLQGAASLIGTLVVCAACAACSGGGASDLQSVSGASNGDASSARSAASLGMVGPAAMKTFKLTVSAGAASCIPHAAGIGTLTHFSSQVQQLRLTVSGLPKSAAFDAFIIQVPNAPFGLAWYQGDIHTNASGDGAVTFLGRFSTETFIVAPGVAPAPVVFGGPFPDASQNPATNPVQLYHVGVWFDSPSVAASAGCPATETPFNGTHNAGIQALNTATFAIGSGPLRGFN